MPLVRHLRRRVRLQHPSRPIAYANFAISYCNDATPRARHSVARHARVSTARKKDMNQYIESTARTEQFVCGAIMVDIHVDNTGALAKAVVQGLDVALL